MKRLLLLALFLLATAPLTAATDPKLANFLERLNKRYYCLSEAGLKKMVWDLTVTQSGIGSPEPSEIYAGHPFPYTFALQGLGSTPTLSLNPGVTAPEDQAKKAEGVKMMAEGLLQLWGLISANQLFASQGTYTLEKTADQGFIVSSQEGPTSLMIAFDSKAMATRMYSQGRKKDFDIGLGFQPSEKGLLLTKLELKEVNCDVAYAPQGGYLLPSEFTINLPLEEGVAKFTLKPANWVLNGTATTTSEKATPLPDLKIIPDATLPPGAKHFFWRAKSATATVYLLGSIHIRPSSPLPVPEFVERSFASSHTVAFEYDMSKKEEVEKQMGDYLQKHYTYPPGDDLTHHLSAQEWALVRAVCKEVGLPEAGAIKFKPIMLGMMLAVLASQNSGESQESGIDEIYLRKARASGKPVCGMEFWWEPLQILEAVPEKDQVKMLLGSYKEIHNTLKHGEDFETAWAAGDTAYFEKLLKDPTMDPGEKALMDRLLKDRNAKWMGQLDRMLKTDKTYFVVVGSAHLLGQFGLPNWLKFKGYQVEQY